MRMCRQCSASSMLHAWAAYRQAGQTSQLCPHSCNSAGRAQSVLQLLLTCAHASYKFLQASLQMCFLLPTPTCKQALQQADSQQLNASWSSSVVTAPTGGL